MKLFFAAVFIFALSGCFVSRKDKQNKQNNQFIKTSEKFIKLGLAFDTTNQRKMLHKNIYTDYSSGLNFDMKTLRKFVDRYGMPNKSTWVIEYDTTSLEGKFVNVIIPMCTKFDSLTKVKKVYLKLSYDYTSKFLPANIVADYSIVKEW